MTDPVEEPIGRRGALVGGLWNVAEMVIPLILTALLSIVLARVLGPEDLGVQSLIAYSESMIFGVLVGSLVIASLQAISASKGSGDAATTHCLTVWQLRLQVINGVVIFAALTIVALLSQYPVPWTLAGATTAVNAIGWAYAARIIVKEGSWKSVSIRRLILQVASQLLGIVAVFAGAGIAGVFAANLVSALALTLLLHQRWRRSTRTDISDSLPAGRPPSQLMRLWWQSGLLAALTLIVGQRVEFFFLARYSGPEQIAMYSVAFMVVSTAVLVPRSAVQAVLPALAASHGGADSERSRSHLAHAIPIMTMLSIPVTAALIILGPGLVLLLYGTQFQQAAWLTAWMAPIVLIVPVSVICQTFLMAQAALAVPIWCSVAGGIIDIALCLLLIPQNGANGAAIANAAGQASTALMITILTIRSVPGARPPLRRWLVAFVFYCGLGGAAGFLLLRLGGVTGWLLAAVTLVVGGGLWGRLVGYVDPGQARWLAETVPVPLLRVLPFLAGRAVERPA